MMDNPHMQPNPTITQLLGMALLGLAVVQPARALAQAAAAAPVPANATAPTAFTITHEKGKHIDVCFGKRPVLRLMVANDTSDDKLAQQTYKVYAHVMDPLDRAGRRRLTKGAGDLYTHHRGIFIGWSKATVEGVGGVDTWHMKGVRQQFVKILDQTSRAESATLSVAIDWVKGDQLLLSEVRTFVVHKPATDGGVLIDHASTITATVGKTVLKGDPEHAGMQFRAHEAAVKNKSAKYLFPDGKKPGNKGDRDMPWAAMTFMIEDRAYSVQHMSHPTLPKGNVYSAYRDYGRFGAYFQKTLNKDEAATFKVRYHISPGAFPADAEASMARRYAAYVKAETRKQG